MAKTAYQREYMRKRRSNTTPIVRPSVALDVRPSVIDSVRPKEEVEFVKKVDI